MGFPEEIYFAMLDLGYCALRDKVPGPLAHILSSGPTDLREVDGDLLPKSTSMAYWRLIGLLQYIRYHGTEVDLTLLQP